MTSLEDFYYAYGSASESAEEGTPPKYDDAEADPHFKESTRSHHAKALTSERSQLLQAYQGRGAQMSAAKSSQPERPVVSATVDGAAAERWRQFFNYERTTAPQQRPADTLEEETADPGMREAQLISDRLRSSFFRDDEPAENDLSGQSSNPGRELHRRGSRWKERVAQHLEHVRHDVESARQKELTFKPKINRTPNYLHQQQEFAERSGEEEDAMATKAAVGERLYTMHAAIQKKNDEAKRERELDEARKLTFQPRLVRAAWLGDVTPRYLSERLNRTPSAAVTEMLQREEVELTYAPVTNKRVPPYVARYLQTPAHKRLSVRYNNTSQAPKSNDDEWNTAETFRFDANGTLEATYSPPNPERSQQIRSASSSRRLTPRQQRSFVERQTRWAQEAELRRKASELAQEEVTPFKPKISSLSKKIAANPELQRPPLTEAPNRGANRTPSAPLEKPVPKIDSRSEELAKHWREQTASEVKRRREKERSEYQAELVRREQAELTFRPDLSELPPETRGFLRTATSSKEKYAEFLSMQRARREKDLRPHREEIAQREREACTGKPEIHDAPEYMKEIAKQMSLARLQSAARHRSHSAHYSPSRGLTFSLGREGGAQRPE